MKSDGEMIVSMIKNTYTSMNHLPPVTYTMVTYNVIHRLLLNSRNFENVATKFNAQQT